MPQVVQSFEQGDWFLFLTQHYSIIIEALVCETKILTQQVSKFLYTLGDANLATYNIGVELTEN